MASLIFAHSKSVLNKARKEAMNIGALMERSGLDYQEWYDKTYQSELDKELMRFEEIIGFANTLHERYKAIVGGGHESKFFITLRPNDTKCTFLEFKEKVEAYVKRKCFIEYEYSFEQKGTNIDDLGKGFHVHIIAKMKQRSKSEVLRDTKSTFNDWITTGKIAENCIEVLVTKNGDKLVQDYLIEYKSDDGHKEVTKKWDYIWREKEGVEKLYSFSLQSQI